MVVSFGGIAFFVYFCMKKKKMIKLFRYIMAVGLLGVIASCDPVRYFPLNVDKLDTNIIELPIDTDSARMEITYDHIGWRCCVYLHLPDGCEVNEDSLAVSFSVPNFSCGRVEKDVIDKRNKPIPLRCSKIDPSHRLSFALYKTGNADIVYNVPAQMYLKMSGVIIKDGKSLVNDTVTVIPMGVPTSKRD